MNTPIYKRILLKISGEALAGDAGRGLNFDVIGAVSAAIKKCVDMGVQVGVVVGGGNFWRGVKDGGDKMVRVRADHMGMLATAINALAVADVLEQHGVEVRVQTAIEMRQVAEPYIRSRAIRHLEKGRVVVFGCGTGNPFFSTDTAAVLRAAEIDADVMMILTSVENVTLNYGTPQEQPISHMTIDQARDYISQGQFEFASMLPKVSASIDFLESGKGRKAIITTLDKAKDSLKGHAGTVIE